MSPSRERGQGSVMEDMAMIPQTFGPQKQTSALEQRSPLLGLVALSAMLMLESCYKTNFSSVIYRCDQYQCPLGLVCNSDSICVNSPVEGCTNGGFSVDVNMFQCPGQRNACESNFRPCVSAPPELACEASGALDMGLAAACVTCCRR